MGTVPFFRPALREIAADPSIHEIILSGGDPLMLPDDELAELTERLAAIPHLRRLRIHTRLPVVIPERVTEGLISAIRPEHENRPLSRRERVRVRAATPSPHHSPHPLPLSQRARGDGSRRLPAIIVLHVNHPAEIDQGVADALGRLVDAGVPLLSQSVLLRGVNDRADVLCELFERLVDLRVIPYYLHQLDPVAGAAHFEVPVTTGVALVSELRARLPGYAVPRYVREVPGGNSKKVLA
jgi:L-lysine 2,3-aminomutase